MTAMESALVDSKLKLRRELEQANMTINEYESKELNSSYVEKYSEPFIR